MAIGYTNAKAKAGTPPLPTSGDHKVIFIDPFGVVSEQWVNDGEDAIVPTPKVYDNLTFTEWNQDTTNITSDKVIGATYSTTDGKTYAKIRLTTVSGLSPTLYLNKSDGSTLTVDWGDNTSSAVTNSGNFNIAHTYAAEGDYVITMWISVGSGTYSFGNGSFSTAFVGGNTQAYRNTLLSISISNSVTSVEKSVFYSCYSLTSISIPNSITSIGENVFQNCYSLTSISIPNSVTSVEKSVFYSCYSLTSISIPNSITSIGENVFQNCYSLTSISIPNSVTSIGISAFYGCSTLTSISIPNSVTSIGPVAFYSCYSLPSISIPKSVTSVEKSVFYSCYSLTSISIPNSITSIGDNAFNSCYSLLEYKIYATTPPTLADINVFTYINSICKIYVPDASVTAYKTATNWANYANYIYPISDIGE